MSRIKVQLPEHFSFSAEIPVRITDLNYGNHVGNDTILSIIHEARVQFLKSCHLGELSFAGTSLIMSHVSIDFRGEAFYGDHFLVYVTVSDFTHAGFHIYYKLMRKGTSDIIAAAVTGMVCFDYSAKKITKVPDEAKKLLNQV